MNNKIVTKILSRFDTLKQARSTINKTLQDITDYVMPETGDFTNVKSTPGDVRSKKMLDSTAADALAKLVSSIHGGLTNSSTKWFQLNLRKREAATEQELKWIDNANDEMLEVFNSSVSGFSANNHEFLSELLGFGTACMFVEDAVDKGIKFKTMHLNSMYFGEDSHGDVDTVFRCFKLTARQAYDMWGDGCSKKVIAAANSSPDDKIEFVHYVGLRGDYGIVPDHFNFEGCYVDVDSKHICRVEGYYEMPYIIGRFGRRAEEQYGYSPAWTAMPSIKLVNQITKDVIKAGQLQAQPPLLLADDGVIAPLNVIPNGIIMGGLSIDGSPRVAPLQIGGQLQISLTLLEKHQNMIKEMFFVDQLYFRPDGTPITATEATQRQEARLQSLSPHMGRIEKEFLNPVITRVFGIMMRSGKFGPIPPTLMNEPWSIEYLSPLAKLQKMQDVIALQRGIQPMAPLIQASPDLLPKVLEIINIREFMKYSLASAGLPLSLIKTNEELDALDKQAQAQQQMQQNMQMAAFAKDMGTPLQ